MGKLPALLRLLGTAALIIAMYSFLVKGWDSGNDVYRYLFMLGHTAIMAAVGLASGHWLKESKGARLLLTLALVSVPANFAILGAFIFSQTTAVDISYYPHYVAWTVENLSTALYTSIGAAIILVPITLLGFTVLARSMSKKLTLLFLLSNAALLLPIRDPHFMAIIVMCFTFINVFISYKASQQNIVSKTQEGVIALGLQMLPLAILMGRSLWLYAMDSFLLSVLAITLFYLLRQASTIFADSAKIQHILDRLSMVPAILVTPSLAFALFDINMLPEALAIPLAAIVSAVMIYDMAERKSSGSHRYRHIASAVLLISLALNSYLFNELWAALASILIGLTVTVTGFKNQQRGVLMTGVILTSLGMLQQFYELFHNFELGSWFALAGLGIVSIVVASTMESQGGKIKSYFGQCKSSLESWDK